MTEVVTMTPIVVDQMLNISPQKRALDDGASPQSLLQMKRQRSDSWDYDDLVKNPLRRKLCVNDSEPLFEATAAATPFDLHLEDIYAGRAQPYDGLVFFESHGYYDVSDANTIQMFRENFGMEAFWEEDEGMEEVYAAYNPLYVEGGIHHMPHAALVVHAHQNDSRGRFQLLDEDGNEIDEETRLEMEREERMKAQSMELDADEIAELAAEQMIVVNAISVIRTEQTRFEQYFFEAFHEEQAQVAQVLPPVMHQPQQAIITQPAPMMDLPTYCGNVHVLKDSMSFLQRSWRKRWMTLDFKTGILTLYKRSYWKAVRGAVDVRTIAKMEQMNGGDFRIEFYEQPMLLVRAKSVDEAELWLSMLRFARGRFGSTAPTSHGAASRNRNVLKKSAQQNQIEVLQYLLGNGNNANSSLSRSTRRSVSAPSSRRAASNQLMAA